MLRPVVGHFPWWRSVWAIFLPWTVSVYALSALAMGLWLPPQGLFRDWGFHLTYLIPAVCVGGVGAAVLTDGAARRTRWSGAMLGAATGAISSLLGAFAACTVLTKQGSEGESWFGLLEFPVVFFATGIGLLIGFYSPRLYTDSSSSNSTDFQS